MYDELLSGEKAISVTGLGYVGLPLALEFAKRFRVIGFDIKPDRIDKMRQGKDPSGQLGKAILRVIQRTYEVHIFIS